MACRPTTEVEGAARIPQAARNQGLVLATAGDRLCLTQVWVTLWGKDRILALGADPAWPHLDPHPSSALISSQNPVPRAVLAPLAQLQGFPAPGW